MDAAEGRCPTEVFETAAAFFNCLISVVREKPKGKPSRRDARALMLQWLPVTDPLNIAQDPECGYGRPAGFLN
jgi:hypothetical protein